MNAISINLLDSDFNNAGSSESTFLFSCPKIFQENKFLLKDFFKDEIGDDWQTESLSKGKKIIYELFSLYKEYGEKNWDGYGALPIPIECIEFTFNFLSTIPQNLPLPELIPEPTGEIGMLWENEEQELTLSIGKDSMITFAGITSDGGELFGSIPFKNSIPRAILDLLRVYI